MFSLYLNSPESMPGTIVSGVLALTVKRANQVRCSAFEARHHVRLSCVEHWQWDETTTSTDSEGNTSTSTVTIHRSNVLFQQSTSVRVLPDSPHTFDASEDFLPMGVHLFGFALEVPADAPCTFSATTERLQYDLAILDEAGLLQSFTQALLVHPLPLDLVDAELTQRAIGTPLPHDDAAKRFLFSKGDVHLEGQLAQRVIQPGADLPVSIELKIENRSSKTINRIVVGLCRLTGNENSGMHIRGPGAQIGELVVLHGELAPGESFTLPPSQVVLRGTGSLSLHQAATVKTEKVFQMFFIQVRAEVKWALDPLLMLPVLLNVPPAALPAPGAPLMRVNGDGCAKTKGKHAQHVVQQEAVAAPTETADELVSHVAALKFDACDRSPSLVAPLPNAVCPEAKFYAWGSLRLSIRAVARLPSKNLLGKGSDVFVKVRVATKPQAKVSFAFQSPCSTKNSDSGVVVLDQSVVFAGGVALGNDVLVKVKNNGALLHRDFGEVLIPASVLALLAAKNARDALAPLPPLPTSASSSTPTVEQLETAGAWALLHGDSASEKASAAVCIALQRVFF
jgi:hypothetical protein